ncbi:uncharacterized protein LOC132703199 [Cylas formicarius]|uniref:uncharacterized protein LOC132703199 n=1 Tax=Cylas formicarius TaxID=197179 RepID=UPI002958ACA5|nr:uncharacterized protein LOC132703199 [Cylas formicarius]
MDRTLSTRDNNKMAEKSYVSNNTEVHASIAGTWKWTYRHRKKQKPFYSLLINRKFFGIHPLLVCICVVSGRNLLDWIGLGTGPDQDPYLAKTNSFCLNGDLASCFQSRALSSLDDFFDKPSYTLTENARLLRLSETHLRSISQEPYEYSQSPRSDDSEWDQLVKFVLRKVEKFMKSTAIEVDFDNQVTENGRYSPRFIDEVVDEIDVLEDKKDSLFKRKKLKKLLIPMLLVLKIFKLKLLLFLPFILGLASFQKVLGFLALVVPGVIAYFKFCKPNFPSNFGSSQFAGPHYSPSGLAYPTHFREQPNFVHHEEYAPGHSHAGLHFRDDNSAQQLAYSGYSEYRNQDKGIEAETDVSTRKSILPDS